MPNNLSGSKIESTYQQVLHLGDASTQALYDGTGSLIESLPITSSFAYLSVSSSLAQNAASASYSTYAVTSSIALNGLYDPTGSELTSSTTQEAIDEMNYNLVSRVDQLATNLGNMSGSIDLDMSKSNIYGTLTNDVTALNITNSPTGSKYTTVVFVVKQNDTTARAMNWSGSGVYPEEGVVVADLEPNQTLDSITQYWLYWAGHLGYWTIAKSNIELTPL